MIKDRGKMKWTSMMLPEHVAMLREWAEEDMYEQRAVLDEQELEAMNLFIAEAMEYQIMAAVTYYENRKHRLMIGYIHYYDDYQRKLHIKDRFEQVHYLHLDNIVEISRFTE